MSADRSERLPKPGWRAPGLLEPGVLPTFRLYVTVVATLQPFLLRLFGVALGINLPWDRYALLILPVPLVMVGYTWMPWWPRRLGPAFLPLGLLVFSASALVEKYVTLAWLVAPPWREMLTLLLMLRLWAIFQLVLLFVAWQYGLRWVIAGALTLCLLDAALSVPFVDLG